MQLAYDTAGPRGAPSVVLLHGLTSSRASYADIVPVVARTWRVLNVDLRGHGQSGRGTRYRAGDYAADVAELIEAEGAGPAVVVGHSLGGVTASALAASSPQLVAGLFLEDPPLFEGDAATRQASPAARFFPAFVAQIRTWQGNGTSEGDVAAALGEQPSAHGTSAGERLGPERMEARARALRTFDPAAMDAAISGETWQGYDPTTPVSCPVTVLAADPNVGAVFRPEHGSRYVAAVPQAQIQTIAGQAHGIHDDPVGQVAYVEALSQFLTRMKR